MTRILIVEDDYLQAEWIEKQIKRSISETQIEKIFTEHDFTIKFEDFKKNPPDIILIDVIYDGLIPILMVNQKLLLMLMKGGIFMQGFVVNHASTKNNKQKIFLLFFTRF